MSNMLIGISGPSASGKTTIARMLAAELNATRLRYSEILIDIAKKQGLNIKDKEALQDLFTSMRDERGEDWLAEEMEKRALQIQAPCLVIEGNRRQADIEMLKELAKARREKLTFIFIDALPEVRFKRYNLKPEEHGYEPVTREEFDELERDPAEDEVPLLRDIAKAEGIYIDTTDCTMEESKQSVRDSLNI